MNYLFLILGFNSFYESMVMSKFVDSLPQSCNIICMSSGIHVTYFSENPRIFKVILQKDINENKKYFDMILKEGYLSAIFIFDFDKLLFDKENKTPFKYDWLENINIPINILDYLDIYNFDDKVGLTRAGLHLSENNEDRIIISKNFKPNIIKISPIADSRNIIKNEKIFYLNYLPTDYYNDDVAKMKIPLGIKDSVKNVLIMFSYEMITESIIQEKQEHYRIIIDVLATYLKKLDVNINLFVLGFDYKPDEILENSKIKYRKFSILNHELYKTMLCFADLVITDTPWNPILIDSIALKKLSCLIGNTLEALEDGSFKGDFETTDNDILEIIKKNIKADIYFKYYCFPIKVNKNEKLLFDFNSYKYLYYLIDIYNSDSVMPFFYHALVDPDEELNKKLNELYEDFNDRARNSLMAFDLIKYISKE